MEWQGLLPLGRMRTGQLVKVVIGVKNDSSLMDWPRLVLGEEARWLMVLR